LAVTVKLPVPLGGAVMVKVDVPEPVMVAGEKNAAAPVGSPGALRPTLVEKPPTDATVTR
jgi:hypothetical protein